MKIRKNLVVSIHYTLKNEDNLVIDTSLDSEPLSYLHGSSQIIYGLERQLEGMKVGDKSQITVFPEEGYGVRDPHQVLKIPRSNFPSNMDLSKGLKIQASLSDSEEIKIFTVQDWDDEAVTIDGNHPLAGQKLIFSIEIVDIRDALEKELLEGNSIS